MSQKFDISVVIGRFQPFHQGHKALLEKAFEVGERVIILIGSSFQPRTIKNPFTFDERKSMILSSLSINDLVRCDVRPIRDQLYNDQEWASGVHQAVLNSINDNPKTKNIPEVEVALVGFFKDDSSYYLNMFPQWALIQAEQTVDLDATTIRNKLFEDKDFPELKDMVSIRTRETIRAWAMEPHYDVLKQEYEHVVRYKEQWSVAPYAPTFVTTDAVVILNGHVLMVKRRAQPGKGLWALPGGFLNQNETVKQGIVRELREETKIKVHPGILGECIKEVRAFDAPGRSLRGRTITHAGLIKLSESHFSGQLPTVKGSDDAEIAKWIHLGQLDFMEDQIFEDHLHIIKAMTGLIINTR